MQQPYTQPAIVIRFEQEAAWLQIGDQLLRWPLHALPHHIKEGDEVTIRIADSTLEKAAQGEQARAILAEILGGRS